MMHLFKEIQKKIDQEGKKFSKSAKALRFPNDFLSLSGFKDIYQGLIIFGSYSLAAVTLPLILNIISTPIAVLCFSLGALITLYGLYHYIKNPEKSFKICSIFDAKGEHIALTGSVMMGIAPVIAILSFIVPSLLTGALIFRAYATIPEETRQNMAGLISNTIRSC